MKKIIITTTIHEPTPAIRLFDAMDDWDLIVVADKGTPQDYQLKHGTFIACGQIEADYKKLLDAIGWNTVDLGRNVGFIEAFRRGADIVATIDDDNIPLANWGKNVRVGSDIHITEYGNPDSLLFDPLSITTQGHLWHRGFPLSAVAERPESQQFEMVRRRVLVQADLWLGDPDIDAICRMIHDPLVDDFGVLPALFAGGRFSPFNTQNTFLAREALIDFCSLPFLGRMDDIWGSYLFEANHPRSVVYGPPSVYSQRYPHDIQQDFRDEILGYERGYEFVTALASGDRTAALAMMPPETGEAFEIYRSYYR